MYLLRFSFTTCFAIIFFLSHGQSSGDKLYAAREKNVTVFMKPDFNSTPIGELRLNSEITIKKKLQLDTNELRIGYWYKIKSNTIKSGYAFGGFFNKEKIADNLTSLENAINSIVSPYPILYSASYGKSQGEIGVDDIGIQISGCRSYTKIKTDFWEGESSEFFFYDIDLNELVNIIETIKSDGKVVDYERLVNSSIPENLSKFQWISGTDDWLTHVTIEKGSGSGVRIFMIAGE